VFRVVFPQGGFSGFRDIDSGTRPFKRPAPNLGVGTLSVISRSGALSSVGRVFPFDLPANRGAGAGLLLLICGESPARIMAVDHHLRLGKIPLKFRLATTLIIMIGAN